MVQPIVVLRVWVLAALCVLAPQALAQALSIVPISQQLAPQQRSASFALTNHSDSEALIQIRSYAWTQTASDDTYSPTSALAISPPFAKIAPGQTQVVRLLLRNGATDSEQAYRVVFDQIPDQTSGKVEMALRLTVPVFSSARAAGQSSVRWRAVLRGDVAQLIAVNGGAQHVQLVNLQVSGADGRMIKLKGQGLPYILSGTERVWPLLDPKHALVADARIHVQTSGPGEHWDQWLAVEKQD